MLQPNTHRTVDVEVETIFTCVITAAVWVFRCRYDYAGVIRDMKYFILFIAWHNRESIQNAATVVFYAYFLLGRNSVALCITTAYSIFCLYTYRSMMVLYKQQQLEQLRGDRDKDEGFRDMNSSSSRLKPLLFPSQVSHTRLFPKTHSFSYSYLMVGIPIGWRGSVGNFLSADVKSLPWNGRTPLAAWFSVESADHLARGDSVHGLQGKLEEYLSSIGEDLEQFDDAYLITAPRFLGYSFNPASFWYLYKNQKLEAMIVEVSNTFDEKRMYFLRNQENETGAHDTGGLVAKWEKDFHVSPFNSRKGSYGIASLDPFHPPLKGERFSNTIQLCSSKHSTKIVARVFSSSPAIDPSTMSGWETIKFMASWWWVGFVTFPRIVREAAKLFFKRSLSVWYRPEVQKESIGRHATKDESAIATLFGDFLRTRVEKSDLPFPLKYTAFTNKRPEEKVYTSKGVNPPNSRPELPRTLSRDEPVTINPDDEIIFKPTTPAFYAKMARSANLTDAVVPKTDPLKSLFYTSHPSLVFELLRQTQTQPHRKAPNATFFKLPDLVRFRWMLIKVLRNMSTKTFVLYDHQAVLSDLDWYAINRASSPKSDAYRHATMKLLTSDFLTFGSPEIIDAVLWAIRVFLYWTYVSLLGELFAHRDNAWSGSFNEMLLTAGRFLGLHLWWGLGQLI